MEKLKNAYDIVLQTLTTLSEALELLEEKNIPSKYYLSFCDSVIQRFEYSIDNFWKFIKIYLTEISKVTIEAHSPKTILRQAYDANVITNEEFETLIKAITRRNETSHAYNKDLAHKILEEIPHYYETMFVVLERLKI
jgi:nucleotidyltransferase substrate binding protein (TIGR01987 family)